MEQLKPLPQAPRVSVVIVSYNCVEALRRCLAALERSAERPSMEILVADNGSTDGSAELDSEFPAVNYLRMPRNFGMTKALNIAVRTATGEYLFFLDPSIEVKPETVSALAAKAGEDPGIGAVCPLIVDAQSGVVATRSWRLPDTAALAAMARGAEPPAGPAVGRDAEGAGGAVAVEYTTLDALMVTRYFVRGMNFFDERYGQHYGDAELAFQLRQAQKKTLVLTSVEVTRTEIVAPAALTTSAAKGALEADRAIGAAVYAAKHFGSGASLKLRLGAILSALGATLAFQAGGSAKLGALIGGQKIDGNQTAF
jgi:GT2 family glycosyltransferase